MPLVAMKHAYVVTEKIPGIENMPNVRDHDASVYLKLQGDALQVGGYEVDPIFIEKLDKDFAFGLYELDYDVFGVHIEGAVNRVPCLENVSDHFSKQSNIKWIYFSLVLKAQCVALSPSLLTTNPSWERIPGSEDISMVLGSTVLA